jgi:hypothetical protein
MFTIVSSNPVIVNSSYYKQIWLVRNLFLITQFGYTNITLGAT